jgi:hypothetical protein
MKMCETRLTDLAHLLKFAEIRRIRADPNSKCAELLFINFKNKKSGKYVKKTR